MSIKVKNQPAFPTTAIFEINGEYSTWGIGDPAKISCVMDLFKERGHNIKLIRALTDLSLITEKTKKDISLRWFR